MTKDNKIKIDPLLECLVLYTKLYHKPFTAEALITGLPVADNETYPKLFSIGSSKSLFSRAAKRAGLVSKLVKKDMDSLSPLTLPAILMLKGGKACILESFSDDKKHARIISPEIGEAENTVLIDDLKKEYLGYAFYIKKEYQYHAKKQNLLKKKRLTGFGVRSRFQKIFIRMSSLHPY